MDSPLNSAHLLSRKAEKFVQLSKFDEAKECHQKAADLLDQAMSLSACSAASESLRLQRNDHIQQQRLIDVKQRRTQKVHKNKHLNGNHSEAIQNGSGESCGSDSDHSNDFSFLSSVQHEMTETHSLLQFLEERCMSDEVVYRPGKSKDSKVSSAVLTDDRVVIEELSMHNKELRKHVLLLLNDMEKLKLENAELKRKVEQSHENTSLGIDGKNSIKESLDVEKYLTLDLDNIDALDLPPLEMPTFDFTAIQNQIGDAEGSCEKHAVS